MTRASADPASLLRSGRGFTERGPVEGKVCRHVVLAVIPWGQADFTRAVDQGLDRKRWGCSSECDGQTSLYGFVPIYNVYSFTCTTVQGIAVKFE